ncbi:MAG: metallo-dependent hydrolase [Clostridium sp.]|nr:metallo-dependent hydrolase [Clostridium sp.]
MGAYLIRNGKIYNPITHELYDGDIAVEKGRIASGPLSEGYETIDADGCIVTAGLIDYHVHYFNHGTENGVNPDAASFPCGVTTAVDGGSCGAANYELYRKSVMAFSDVRILNMLLMGSGGQITDRYPEHLEEKYFDIEKIRALFSRYPRNLTGLKLRLSEGIIGAQEGERSLVRTVELAEELGCNVCVHITNPVMELERLAGYLRKGDVICHIYQGKGRDTVLGPDGSIHRGILEARERGVLFDASNGCNNYDLEICRRAMEQGFTPDIISSDINTSGFYRQPLHSLPRILSKFMDLGMTLAQVLDAATLRPAQLIRREDLASLEPGTTADIAVFKVKKKDVLYQDRAGHTFKGRHVIVPQMTIKSGAIMYCQADFC